VQRICKGLRNISQHIAIKTYVYVHIMMRLIPRILTEHKQML